MPSFTYYASAPSSISAQFSYIILIFYIILSFYNIVILPARCGPGPIISSLWSWSYYVVVIMSYYNQPLPGRGKAKLKNGARQIQKWCKPMEN